MRGFIVAAASCKKPANFPGDCMGLIKPCQEVMQASGRRSVAGAMAFYDATSARVAGRPRACVECN